MRLTDRAVALARAHPAQFTVQYPPRREYFQERYRAHLGADAFATARLLYVHVPFCARRCAYCNFAIDVRPDELRMERYVDALVREIEALPAHVGHDGIDVGGGTPLLLPVSLLRRLSSALARRARFSIETTPALAAERPASLEALSLGGATRLSIGLQSAEPAQLGALGRDPRIELHARAVATARRAGFRRVSVDLIFGLPGQTEASFAKDLDAAIATEADAITTYDCLYRGRGRALSARSDAPTPDTYGRLYDLAHARLMRAGFFAPYGSINFSRHDGESGTSAYFEARIRDGAAYVGIGDYATSHAGDAWAFATRGVDAWLASSRAYADAYLLPRVEVMAKHLLLTLSYGRIDRRRFAARFGESLDGRFTAALERAVEEGWLREERLGFAVTQFAAMPVLRALFYPERAIRWLEVLSSRMLPAWNTRTSIGCSAGSAPSPAGISQSSALSSTTR